MITRNILIYFILCFYFLNGDVLEIKNSQTFHKNFIFANNNTIIDILNNQSIFVNNIKLNWYDSLNFCKQNNMELLTLSNFKLFKSAINKLDTKPDFINLGKYWLIDEYLSDKNYAWNGSIEDSKSDWDLKEIKIGFMCSAKQANNNVLSAISNDILNEMISKAITKPNVFQKLEKDQFETTSDFEKRIIITKQHNQKAIEQYKKDYQDLYPKAKIEAMKKSLEIYYGKPIVTDLIYDADNEVFGAKLNFENNKQLNYNIVFKVSKHNAKEFYSNFSSIYPVAIFSFDGVNVAFETIKLEHNGTIYLSLINHQQFSTDLRMAKLDTENMDLPKTTETISISNSTNSIDTSLFVSTNDLDNLMSKIPQAKSNNKKWLFIVGLENYKYTDNVIYSTRSAESFAKVASKVFGVPKENSYILLNENATAAEIKTKLKLLLRNVQEGDSIYFYYNGHGVPAVDKQNEPFLLSSDMMPDFVAEEKELMLSQIYKNLSDSKASNIVAFIDSCFSGTTDGKSVFKGVAATKMKPKSIEFDKSKMVVMTAGKDNQFSNAYNQKAHRMFSYFVMEELLNGEKNIQELFNKVYKNTKSTTMKHYGDMRLQEPQIEGNINLDL